MGTPPDTSKVAVVPPAAQPGPGGCPEQPIAGSVDHNAIDDGRPSLETMPGRSGHDQCGSDGRALLLGSSRGDQWPGWKK